MAEPSVVATSTPTVWPVGGGDDSDTWNAALVVPALPSAIVTLPTESDRFTAGPGVPSSFTIVPIANGSAITAFGVGALRLRRSVSFGSATPSPLIGTLTTLLVSPWLNVNGCGLGVSAV